MKAGILLKDFSFKIEGDFSFLIVQGFLSKTRASLARAAFYTDFFYKTCASLARAAFTRDFLYNQKGRRSRAGMAQQLEPAPFPSHSL